jgi:hypothetical protein
MPFSSSCISTNLTNINMLLKWLQQQELIDEHMIWWIMKAGLQRCFLRLESSMYVLLSFLWHRQRHGIHIFSFSGHLKKF